MTVEISPRTRLISLKFLQEQKFICCNKGWLNNMIQYALNFIKKKEKNGSVNFQGQTSFLKKVHCEPFRDNFESRLSNKY